MSGGREGGEGAKGERRPSIGSALQKTLKYCWREGRRGEYRDKCRGKQPTLSPNCRTRVSEGLEATPWKGPKAVTTMRSCAGG
jgi:hypothetical protein